MVEGYNSNREHEKSSRQGKRAGLGGGTSTCVNEAVAAARGAALVSAPVLGARRKKHISASRAGAGSSSGHRCRPAGVSGWSLPAWAEML